MSICYIANGAAGGGIQRWDFNGTSWVQSYTLHTASGFSFVTADFSGANPTLYATTLASGGNDSIVTFTDIGGGSESGFNILATTTQTGGSATFNGLVLVPAPEPSSLAVGALGWAVCIGARRLAGRRV